MREDEIYFYTKELLKLKNFKIIAGQPPNGSDNIPSIEIKESNHFDKGSKGSFKPDLVAIDRNNFLIIECKPKYDFNDKKKLESVLFDNKRKKNFYKEILQRKLIHKYDFYSFFDSFNKFNNKLRFCLSNTSKNKLKFLTNFYIDIIPNNSGVIDPEEDKFKII